MGLIGSSKSKDCIPLKELTCFTLLSALRYAAAIFTEGDGREAVEPLVTLHNNIPLHQVMMEINDMVV